MSLVFGFLLATLFFVLHPAGRAVFSPPFAAQRSSRHLVQILIAFFAVALVGNLVVLLTLSSEGVHSDGDEVGFYLAATAASLLVALFAFEYAGVSFRDDVLARGNPGAATTICGLTIGEGFCLAGSNTGNGPGPEVVFFCAALSTVALFLVWVLLDALSGIVERITVERDLAAGIRSGAFLSGAGAVLGASIAGNWVSFTRTMTDLLRFGWPTIVLLAVAAIAEVVLQKRGWLVSVGYGTTLFALCVFYAVRIWSLA